MNLIDFAAAKKNLLKNRYAPQLRMLGDFIEYCVIPEYDEMVDFETLERVQVDDVRVHLLRMDGRYLLASILFAKDEFTVSDVALWLFDFNILLEQEAHYDQFIPDALKLVLGVTFSEQPLVKYSKGPYEIFYCSEDFDEVLETFDKREPEILDFGTAEYEEPD